jgi:predicted RNA-binding Zn-ribbon protein involved in translation (DUF1610 family)
MFKRCLGSGQEVQAAVASFVLCPGCGKAFTVVRRDRKNVIRAHGEYVEQVR